MQTTPRSGIVHGFGDPAVRPQDDFFGHVNGRWWATTPVREDRARAGSFVELAETVEAQVQALCDQVADGSVPTDQQPDVEELTAAAALVGALYGSYVDRDTVEGHGVAPLQPWLADVAAVGSVDELVELMGRLQRQGTGGVWRPYVFPDPGSPERYVLHLQQDGLGLPDESYYREERFEPLRVEYRAVAEDLLTRVGVPEPERVADQATALEARLAAAHWDKVRTRDAVEAYTLVPADTLAEVAPGVPWEAWFAGVQAPQAAREQVVVRQPSFAAAVGQALLEEPLEAWRAWLTWQAVMRAAPYLTDELAEAHFGFFGRRLTGQPQRKERSRRAVDFVTTAAGQALGRLYVARHFPPAAKAHVDALVGHLLAAYREDIERLDWMGPETRQRALAKLAAFRAKIGYPDVWRDYSALTARPDDLFGNAARAAAFEADRQLALAGGPVDRDEWLMPPHVVNAYYNPLQNEIVFPAAILQPPFFDADADDAANFGGIGAVIGHEVGHGFDDQGSRYDADGGLVDWWTAEDRQRFDALTQQLVKQFGDLGTRDLPGASVNGALTLGENIGDLGGLGLAYQAYRRSLGSGEQAVLDGLSGDQRFFVGWAQVWRGKSRPEEAERLLTVDPHSPWDVRCNAVRNVDAFHEAFGVQPGDGMWLDPADRVRIW